MKKRARVHSHTYNANRPRLQPAPQMHKRGNFRWLIISAICIAAFVCLIGVASAASASSGAATQAAKDQKLQRLIDAGKTHIAAKTGIHNQAQVAQPAPDRRAGIINMHQGPFLTSTFTVRNFWQGQVGNDWVLVYSGAKTKSDGKAGSGGLVLYTETANAQGGFDLHPLGTFLAPNGTTALTIAAANGNRLQLSSASGANLTFDLVTHQFH
ncbi:MAG: hypothetical protein ABI234_09560 [Ktedonobacteraceae bacterium]